MIRVATPARLAVAGVAVTLAVALSSGCSGSSDGGSGGGSGGTSTPAASGGSTAKPRAAGTSAPAKSSSGSGRKNTAPPLDTGKPSVAISTAPAVSVGKKASLGNDVKVTVSTVRKVEVKASGPGDIAGAGVSVALTVENGSAKAFDLGGLAVTASYGKDKPAVPGGAGNGDPLSGSLRAGKTAKGQYVFNVPSAQAKSLQVQVSSNESPIILVFTR